MRINLAELKKGQTLTVSHRATPAQTVKTIDQVSTHTATSPEVRELAQIYKGNLPGLFRHVHSRIAYENDPPDHQRVRTPARSLSDGRGNCVDYTTIISAVLKAQGIPHKYRVVKYGPGGWQHIYPVAQGIPLDAVVGQRQDGSELNGTRSTPVYGKELPYLAKWDYMPRLSILGTTSSSHATPSQLDAIRKTVMDFNNTCSDIYSSVGGSVRRAKRVAEDTGIKYDSNESRAPVWKILDEHCRKITCNSGINKNKERNCKEYVSKFFGYLPPSGSVMTQGQWVVPNVPTPYSSQSDNWDRSQISANTNVNQAAISWLLPVALIGGLFMLTNKKKRR